jgi:hypothetical protein
MSDSDRYTILAGGMPNKPDAPGGDAPEDEETEDEEEEEPS